MVNKDRMVGEFLELVQVDSLTKQERQMADLIKSKLEAMGLAVQEDDTGSKIGGNTGNLHAVVKGKEDVPGVILTAHMDTVVPGIGKKPVIENGYIRSDGTTILGGDDLAGVECIFETVRVLKENGLPHGDIHIVLTVAEEGGLYGAKHFDYAATGAKYAFVLDEGGPIGTVAVKAPSQNKIDITVKGKAAHAGVEPEKGISAIQIASLAISQMQLGRIDHETTANIGIITGGQATNIICDKVEIKGEARSIDAQKLERQTEHMRKCFEDAASQLGGAVDFRAEIMYPSFDIPHNHAIIDVLRRASAHTGIPLVLESTGGGSDTNIINGVGIPAVNVSVGMDKVHSVEEQIRIEDMIKAVEFLAAAVTNV